MNPHIFRLHDVTHNPFAALLTKLRKVVFNGNSAAISTKQLLFEYFINSLSVIYNMMYG